MNKIKLHLGCGNIKLPGFINIDVRNLDSADIVTNIKEIKEFKHNSVDLIYCSHVLEHFGRHEYKNVLSNWYDLLKINGILRLSIPNFEKVVEHYCENKSLRSLLGFLYGGQTYLENFHYCIWDFKTIKEDLEELNFKDIIEYDWKKTEHCNFDDYSQSYLPHMDKINGKLMSLNIEARK